MTFAARSSWNSGAAAPPPPAGGVYQATFDTAFAGGNTITLDLGVLGGSPVDLLVEWGDGATEFVTADGSVSHTYSGMAIFTVTITGTVELIDPSPSGQAALIGVDSWDDLMGLTQTFARSSNLTYVPNTLPSTITDLNNMFYGSYSFNQDIGGWNTVNVVYMQDMFHGANSFNGPIGTWDTSAVQNMSNMFYVADAFNQPLDNWDTGAVANMDFMFYGALVFDQDISGWCVYLIPSEPSGFNGLGVLTPAYFPVWGTCPVVIPFPLTLYGGGYNAFGAISAAAYPLTLYGGGYNAFGAISAAAYPLTLSR